jgi:hypothetical protein
MPNGTRCFWVSDVTDIRPDGDVMRVELEDDFGKIVIRMSLRTLTTGHERAHKVLLEHLGNGEVVPLRKRRIKV